MTSPEDLVRMAYPTTFFNCPWTQCGIGTFFTNLCTCWQQAPLLVEIGSCQKPFSLGGSTHSLPIYGDVSGSPTVNLCYHRFFICQVVPFFVFPEPNGFRKRAFHWKSVNGIMPLGTYRILLFHSDYTLPVGAGIVMSWLSGYVKTFWPWI
jgi:hypothetical protein